MKIELLMRSLDQEFADSQLLTTTKPQGQRDDKWPFDYWSHDRHCDRWSYQTRFDGDKPLSDRFLDYIILRTEGFGGVLYDMLTKAVFRIDGDAYRAIQHLRESRSYENTADALHLPQKDISELREQLIRFRLCSA